MTSQIYPGQQSGIKNTYKKHTFSFSKSLLLTTLTVILLSNQSVYAQNTTITTANTTSVTTNSTSSNNNNSSTIQTSTGTQLTNVSENVLYQGIKLDQRSFNNYRYNVGNKTQQQLNNSYLYFRVDSDDSFSDPDIFISKTVMNPRSHMESDQYCMRAGSNLCFMRKDKYKANDTIYFSVRCIEKCQYSLRIGFAPIINVTDGVNNLKQSMDAKSAAVYQFQIPDLSQDGFTQSVQFQAESLAQSNPLEIMFSVTDDLTQIEEKHLDMVTENGKVMKFTSDDYGWCTSCSVFFIVSARAPGIYQISTKASARKEIIPEQQSIVRSVNQFERECFSYNILKSTNDVVFTVRQQQGDLDLQLVLKNPLNSSSEINLLNSETYSTRGLISKASDRAKLNFTTGLIYLCANPYTDSSFQIFASQQYQLSRFDVQEDTLYTLSLDAQEYAYFRYTSQLLTNSKQIQVQVSNFITVGGTVPRMYYRVCPSPNPEECYLSDSMAKGFWDGDVILTELFNTTNQTNTKVGIINHNPSVCPFPSSCYYLISVFNQDLSGSQRFTFRTSILNQDPIPLQIGQQYQDQINQNQMTQYTLLVSPLQLYNWNISTIYFNLTSYNGRADLYLSTQNKTPSLSSYEIRSRSLQPWTNIAYNVTGKDLSTFKINIAVYGNVRTQYTLRIYADYYLTQPSSIINDQTINIIQSNLTNSTTNSTRNNTVVNSNQTNNTNQTNNSSISNTTKPQNTSGSNSTQPQLPILNITYPANATNLTVYKTLVDVNTRKQYSLTSNSTDIIIYYYPGQGASGSPIHFKPFVDSITTNGTINFNVTYGNNSWNNNSIGLTINPEQWTFNPQHIFTIRIRCDFKLTNRTAIMNILYPPSKNASSSATKINPWSVLLNATFRFGVYQANQTANYIDYAQLSTTYEGFANKSYVVFKHLLMDTNGTYKFRLDNGIGKPYLMQKNGALVLQQFEIIDDTTYDFASSAPDTFDYQELTVTKFMRENANFRCRNASYTLRGGNENCTMYVAVQCKELCTFNLTISLVEASNRTVKIPSLIKSNTLQFGRVESKSVQYYYTPFVRGDLNDSAIVLSKLDYNDTFMTVKIINNGHLPYYNWTYPTQSSFDLISRTVNDSVEILELTQSMLISRCTFNSSCILLIGVFHNSTTALMTQNYQLQILGSQNRLGNNSLTQGYIMNQNQMSYYWFIVNTTNTTSRNVTWRHLISAAPTTQLQDIDVYINAIDSQLPSINSYDFEADRLGNDMIILSSDMNVFRAVKRERLLVQIGIKARNPQTNFTLLNWGPNAYEAQFLNFTDIKLKQPLNITLLAKNRQPMYNYKILRFFNYGITDLLINITSYDGQIYTLANRNNFKHQVTNSYFNVPLVPQLSKLSVQNLNKSQSFALRINSSSNSQIFCTFCWIYVAVFQNNSNVASTSLFGVNVTDMSNQDSVPNLNLGQVQTQVLPLTNIMVQRKFLFENKGQVNLMVNSNNTNITAYLSLSPDQYKGNFSIWNSTFKGNKTLTMRQTDQNLKAGQFYYLTVVANQNNCNITMKVEQRRTVSLLKENQSILDSMETPEDYIKYYYYLPPSIPNNSTITLTITPLSSGFMPNIYVQRNDIQNQSYSLNQLAYPSINQSTFSQEQFFYQQYQKVYTFQFNVSATNRTLNVSSTIQQNYTQNVTTLVNVTTIELNRTTNKNQTVVKLVNQTTLVNMTRNVTVYNNVQILNQTYYTIALYWSNYGLSDLPRAQYEISYNVTALTGKIQIQQPNNFESTQNENTSIVSYFTNQYKRLSGFIKQKLQHQ